MNLYKETVAELHAQGKTTEDVKWVGSNTVWFSWAEFAAIASETAYYEGFGHQEIALDLLIVGSDWWLERHEYDGSEWWAYKKLPQKPVKHIIPSRLHSVYGWDSVDTVNEEENEG